MSVRVVNCLFARCLSGVRFHSKSFTAVSAASSRLSIWNLTSTTHLPVASNADFQIRNYAKGKDKIKSKKGSKVDVDPHQLNEVIDFDNVKKEFEDCLQRLQEDNAKHLSLRSSVGSIESLKVNFSGKDHDLQELAQVIRKNTKTVVLQMGAFPAAIPKVIKALQESGMNLNPQQDGNNVYVPIPKVTKEHREHLTKNARVLFVKCRNAMKAINLALIKDLKKQEKLPEDFAYNARKQIDALTDQYVLKAKTITDAKCAEIIKSD